MALAFQCGLTDVATLMLSYANTMIPGGQLMACYGVPNITGGTLHKASHYASDGTGIGSLETIKQFEIWHMTQLAFLAQLLKTTPDSDGRTLLDNSVVLFGASMGDSDKHNYNGMLRVLLGKGAGLNPGPNGKLIDAGSGDAHPKLLQTIANAFGTTGTVGVSGGQTIPGIFGS